LTAVHFADMNYSFLIRHLPHSHHSPHTHSPPHPSDNEGFNTITTGGGCFETRFVWRLSSLISVVALRVLFSWLCKNILLFLPNFFSLWTAWNPSLKHLGGLDPTVGHLRKAFSP
jgi:hypothetical protein